MTDAKTPGDRAGMPRYGAEAPALLDLAVDQITGTEKALLIEQIERLTVAEIVLKPIVGRVLWTAREEAPLAAPLVSYQQYMAASMAPCPLACRARCPREGNRTLFGLTPPARVSRALTDAFGKVLALPSRLLADNRKRPALKDKAGPASEASLKVGVDTPPATTAVLLKLRSGLGQLAEAGVDSWRLARRLVPARLPRNLRRIVPEKWIRRIDCPWREVIKSTLLVGMSTAFLWVFSRIWLSGSHYVLEPSRPILTIEILLMGAVLLFGLSEFIRHLMPARRHRRRAHPGSGAGRALPRHPATSPGGVARAAIRHRYPPIDT